MSNELSAIYDQENKGRLQTKACEKYQDLFEEKIRTNMVVKKVNIKISLKMKNKG